MKGYALGAQGFGAYTFSKPDVQSEDVRVAVEYTCLEVADKNGTFCPGGGLIGTVVECGDAATALMGARVLVPQVIACGECQTCRRGAATVCPNRSILGVDCHGGCAETVVCAGRWLTRTGQGLDVEGPIAALIAGPGLHAYALFCRAGVTAGDVTIVIGRGPTAAIVARLAQGRGAKLIAVASDGDSAVARIAEGMAMQNCQDRPQKIFVCDGKTCLDLALEIAHPASVIISAVGTGLASMEVLHQRELSLLALGYGHPDLLPEAAALVVKGELDIKDVLCEAELGNDSLDESQRAFDAGTCLVVHHHK